MHFFYSNFCHLQKIDIFLSVCVWFQVHFAFICEVLLLIGNNYCMKCIFTTVTWSTLQVLWVTYFYTLNLISFQVAGGMNDPSCCKHVWYCLAEAFLKFSLLFMIWLKLSFIFIPSIHCMSMSCNNDLSMALPPQVQRCFIQYSSKVSSLSSFFVYRNNFFSSFKDTLLLDFVASFFSKCQN